MPRVMTYRSPTSGQILTLDGKDPTEIIGYRFNLLSIQAFNDYAETFADANSVIWRIYNSAAITTNIPLMRNSQEASVSDNWVQCNVQSGTHSNLYFLKGSLTASSGRVYNIHGSIFVFNPLEAIVPVVVSGGGGSTGIDGSIKSGELVLTPNTTNVGSSSLIGCTVVSIDPTHLRIIWDTDYATALYFFDVYGMSSLGAEIDIVPGSGVDSTKTASYVTLEIPSGVARLVFQAHGENA